MFGVTITDMDERGGLAIDLRDILTVLGSAALESRWKIEGVEAIGSPAAETLQKLSDVSAIVSGDELVRLASAVYQIVDGKFSAFQGDSDLPWIVIRAVDSAAYDVTSDRLDVLDAVKNTFRSAEYIPGMEPGFGT
ncbi:MAG TPA: hypothetical protein EYP04_09605 [Anaerolineae bacterium]|nr:hypothetical protein [Anaerolineae bacterium]